MFKRNNMRVLLVLSVALFVLCSSVNMVPTRTFLDDIKRYSKRQGGEFSSCDDPDFLCSNGSHNNILCGFHSPFGGCDEDTGLYHNISCIIYSAKIYIVLLITSHSKAFIEFK